MGERSDLTVLSWDQKLSELENLVVAGLHDQCRQQMDSFLPLRIPRELAPRLAQLASRIHHSIFALKVLYPYVFPESSLAQPASALEKSIYAYALLNLGASSEALELLESIDCSDDPEIFLQKSLAHFKDWNYSKSIPLLEMFIKSETLPPYRKIVGQVNLVAALICLSRWSAAIELLDIIEEQCHAGNFQLLLGNSFELRAQVHFFQKNYAQAISCLEKAREILKNQQGLYLIFVEKWLTICRCFQSASLENLQQLQHLKEKANSESRWETVRECDLFESILKKDDALFQKVIMGTPSESYRLRARQLFGQSSRRIGPYNLLISGDEFDLNPQMFNPYQAGPKGERLSEKGHLLALFEALTFDFYKPSHLGSLFKTIYPEEKFNPSTSPQRVLQLLKRLDLWFKEHNWPLYVQFKKSEFAIKAHKSILITVQRGKKLTDFEIKREEVRKHFDGRTFTASQLSKQLELSKTSTNQMIKRLLSEASLITVGKGRGVFYQFSERKKAKPAA